MQVNTLKAYSFQGSFSIPQGFRGKRFKPIKNQQRGKYAKFKFPQKRPQNIALDATIRAMRARWALTANNNSISTVDIREKILKHRSSFVITFIVDNSWSMHVEKTLEKIKGMILSFLKDARNHGDKVSLVAFRHSRAPEGAVVLPPTKSFLQAEARLKNIPLSGTTPLPDAFLKAYKVLKREKYKNKNAIPVLIVVSDGIPTFSIKPGGDPYEELYALCRLLRRQEIKVTIIDTMAAEKGAIKSCCRQLAALTCGQYLTWAELTEK